VEEGDPVRKEQLLAVLEDDEQAIRNKKAADALTTLERELARSDSLLNQGMLSVEGHEEIRQKVEAARHEASLAELELSRTRIRAPFTGMVLTRFLDAGSVVADGTEVFEVADLKPLYADVQIPEKHVARISPGQEVRLTNESGELRILAEIERIAPRVDPATGTVKVTIAVSEEESIRPGTFVRVSIVTGSREGALVVPRSAMVAEGRRWKIFRLITGNKVEALGVEPGFEEGDLVEILRLTGQETLQENDPVIINGASALSDGDTVQIIPAESNGDSGVTS
jgi:RND family efflux transporter MFP subunit